MNLPEIGPLCVFFTFINILIMIHYGLDMYNSFFYSFYSSNQIKHSLNRQLFNLYYKA